MKFPDLDALLKEPKFAKDLALLGALQKLAGLGGRRKADLAYYEIQVAIDNLSNRFKRTNRIRQAASERLALPLPKNAPLATIEESVRAKSHKLGLASPRKPAVEQRAIDILRGVPRKARKNFFETQAVQLADAVFAEWPMPKRSVGPPARRLIWAVDIKATSEAYDIIEAALPIIKELAAPGSSWAPHSATIAALRAVVKATATIQKPTNHKVKAAGTATHTTLSAEYVANVVRDLRKRRSNL
ncbi:hypothetical protein [Bradyrhizobium sp. AUGA SZCCT0042]|uniref:hypothetical protein n=1 Tax=Bradyrhizobium sp. AUGA SZCCT0042 TaxID=2807651 RepID=UPI001BA5FA53|nr:hypothetical protein [Bradyrhizobium sp. AUGA SZCCT0042]MBR1301243.1 hypothetical protein [Bradyrhizobium sp. AUGA SZCCT0042]